MRFVALTIMLLIFTAAFTGCSGTASEVSVNNPFTDSAQAQVQQQEYSNWDAYYNEGMGY